MKPRHVVVLLAVLLFGIAATYTIPRVRDLQDVRLPAAASVPIGDSLVWNGTRWTNATIAGGGAGTATNLAAGATGLDLTLTGPLNGTTGTFSGTLSAAMLDVDLTTTSLLRATNTALTFSVTTTQPVSATTNWCVPFCGGEYTNALGLFTVTNNVNLATSTNRGDGGRTFTMVLRNFTGSNVMLGWNTNWINLGSSHPPVTLSNGFSMGVAMGAWGSAETQAVISVKTSIRN